MTKLRDKNLADNLRKKYTLGWSHSDVQFFLKNDYNIEVTKRTIKRWKKNLKNDSWQGPKIPCPPIIRKVNSEMSKRICTLRLKTGWGSYPLKILFPYDISESTYKRLIKTAGLSRGSKIENKRIHWVKWQRNHPDSLWQIDSFQLEDGSWMTCVIDDCSRYCMGIRKHEHLTIAAVTSLLEDIILRHGKPREILTDNGKEHGLTSKSSQFDEWCNKQGITHIRSRIHKPTTAGKVERFQQTVQKELPFCKEDIEMFRYRYNHIRPHMSLHGKRPSEIYFDISQRLKETITKPQTWWE